MYKSNRTLGNIGVVSNRNNYFYQQLSQIVSELKYSIALGCDISEDSKRIQLIETALTNSDQVSNINVKIKLLKQFNQLKTFLTEGCNDDLKTKELKLLKEIGMDLYGYFYFTK